MARVVGLVVVAAGLGAALWPARAGAGPFARYVHSRDMRPRGTELRPNPAPGVFNTDLAFWGKRAYQGTYDGFRIIDISDRRPRSIVDYDRCRGDQGDVVVWRQLLVRTWNTPTVGSRTTCDGEAVPSGFEGLHVFDVSRPSAPDLVASIPLPCGSHTATAVPDAATERLLVYSSASSSACPWIDIVEIPPAAPEAAAPVGIAPAARPCHDTGVILGDAMMVACAGGNGFTVFDIGGEAGGTVTAPVLLYSAVVPNVSIGHSAAFSFDGRVIVFGHEPGGGAQARCQRSSADTDKSLFFFRASTGDMLGRWVLPRPQSSIENCTLHNYNVVPIEGRRILVSGNYQAGIAVVNFSRPGRARQIAFADPRPLDPPRLGGDWSSYFFRGRVFESDITRGLLTWRLTDRRVSGARRLGHLNPQTQHFTLGRGG